VDYDWISFNLDLRKMAPPFWMRLGESRSKCMHLSRVPLPHENAERLHQVTLARGVHATTAIEGNTLSEEEVLAIVQRGVPDESATYPEREVENVLSAYNWVLGELRQGNVPQLSPGLIAEFNRRVLNGLNNPGDDVVPGELRRHSVVVGPYRRPDWEHCPALVAQMCDWLNGPQFDGEGDQRLPTAIIRASMAHLYLAWIHPFGDGNGRTARLCEFLVLVTSGVPTSAAHLISNHCNRTRNEYYRQLQRASESGGDVSGFLSYCVEGFVGGLEEQLAEIYRRQFELTWQEFVSSQVTGRDRAMRERRQLIAQALLYHEPVPRTAIPTMSGTLGRIYATCGPRTLARDLNELVSLGLIRLLPDGYAANGEILQNLLPLVVGSDTESSNTVVDL
jgi:Fic family protein